MMISILYSHVPKRALINSYRHKRLLIDFCLENISMLRTRSNGFPRDARNSIETPPKTLQIGD